MDNFIPKTDKEEQDVPWFDDVTSDAGWQGQTTQKSLQTLQSEITEALGRLGAMVVGFQRGAFGKREGYRIHYTVQRPDGKMWPGQIDIAALPVKPDEGRMRSLETRQEKSLKMALYMFRMALNGSWFLQQLSPGYAPLMPWMLVPSKEGTKTFAQIYGSMMNNENLLPSGMEDEIEEGDFEVIDG